MIFFCEDSDALLFGRVCIIAKIAVVVSVHLRKYKGEGGGGGVFSNLFETNTTSFVCVGWAKQWKFDPQNIVWNLCVVQNCSLGLWS